MGKVGERIIFVVVKADSFFGELMAVERIGVTVEGIEDVTPAVGKLMTMVLADGAAAAAAAAAVVVSRKGVERR